MAGKHEQYIPHPVEPTASGILGYWIPLVIPSGSHGRWCIASTPENVESPSNRTGRAREETKRRKRGRENDAEQEVGQRERGEIPRRAHENISRNAENRNTSRPELSSSSSSRRDVGGPLCDIGDRRHFAVTASYSAPLLRLLPLSFSPLFIIVYSFSRITVFRI